MPEKKQITNIDDIIEHFGAFALNDQVRQSKIFSDIVLEIYNGWPWDIGIERIQEKIKFFADVLPMYAKLFGTSELEALEIISSARNCNYTNWFQHGNVPCKFDTVSAMKNVTIIWHKYITQYKDYKPCINTYEAKSDWVIVLFSTGETIEYEKAVIADCFEKYGGSFVMALGTALHRADGHNTYKILNAFKWYVSEYIETFLYSKKQDHAK